MLKRASHRHWTHRPTALVACLPRFVPFSTYNDPLNVAQRFLQNVHGSSLQASATPTTADSAFPSNQTCLPDTGITERKRILDHVIESALFPARHAARPEDTRGVGSPEDRLAWRARPAFPPPAAARQLDSPAPQKVR